MTNNIGQELKLAILKKAAELKQISTKKEVEEYRKKNRNQFMQDKVKVLPKTKIFFVKITSKIV